MAKPDAARRKELKQAAKGGGIVAAVKALLPGQSQPVTETPQPEAPAQPEPKAETPNNDPAKAATVTEPTTAPAPKAEVDNDLENVVLALDERVDTMNGRLTATEKVVGEHSAQIKALAGKVEGDATPAEARLAALFDLKVKTAAEKLTAGLGDKVAEANTQSKDAMEKAAQALKAADQAAKDAKRLADSASTDVDRVLNAANEALEVAGGKLDIMEQALGQMQEIGQFVDQAKAEIDKKVAELREELAGQLAELRYLIQNANQPVPPPPAPQPVEEKPLFPWQKKG